MLSSPRKDVNSVLNKIGRQRGEEGSVIEVRCISREPFCAGGPSARRYPYMRLSLLGQR
jgi:hypothetical protein